MNDKAKEIIRYLKSYEDDKELLQDKISVIDTNMKALKLRLMELIFGVKEGVIVRCNGILHRVTKVDVRYLKSDDLSKASKKPDEDYNRPWLEGNPMKKDGTYGIAIRSLYSHWEVVE